MTCRIGGDDASLRDDPTLSYVFAPLVSDVRKSRQRNGEKDSESDESRCYIRAASRLRTGALVCDARQRREATDRRRAKGPAEGSTTLFWTTESVDMSDGRDAEFEEHVRTWRGFTRLMTVSNAAAAVILVGMELALL